MNKKSRISYENSVNEDEQEEFPIVAVNALEKWGLPEHLIPFELGGNLTSAEECMSLAKVIARRDLTAAIGQFKTILGSLPVWIGGNIEQKVGLSKMVRKGFNVSMALTERNHGSDLLASAVLARQEGQGYILSGEKWLINNATRSQIVCILAKTNEGGGTRGFSLFLVQKSLCSPSSYHHLPKIKTHGIRGADISGIQFKNCRVPSESVVGRLGYGLDLVLHALQITRTFCAGLSLGAADTAVRLCYTFVQDRILYGKPVWEIPVVREYFVDVLTDLWICEAVAFVGTRGLQYRPAQMSLWSSIIKYFVPTTVDQIFQNMSVVLGARHYIREEFMGGIFQKFNRDHQVIALFDGSTQINLSAIASQLPALTRASQERSPLLESGDLAQLFDLSIHPGQMSFHGYRFTNQGLDDVSSALTLEYNGSSNWIKERVVELQSLQRQLYQSISKFTQQGLTPNSPEIFELARIYTLLFAAACCIQVNQHNLELLGKDENWLMIALHRLLVKIRGGYQFQGPKIKMAEESILWELEKRVKNHLSFGIVPFSLASD